MSEPVFDELDLWIDPAARSGAENMAVDEWLYNLQSSRPILRFYHWRDPAVSFGYFEKLETARASFSGAGLEYVRRLTGGGIVDHRVGATYTVIAPNAHPLTTARGDASYCVLHKILVASLAQCGVRAELADGANSTGENACFVNPVAQDVVDAHGAKIAGAGQKRGRFGLLHQGCVVGAQGAWQQCFAENLAQRVIEKDFARTLDLKEIGRLSEERYAHPAWVEKR